jgi:hypothetical protein
MRQIVALGNLRVWFRLSSLAGDGSNLNGFPSRGGCCVSLSGGGSRWACPGHKERALGRLRVSEAAVERIRENARPQTDASLSAPFSPVVAPPGPCAAVAAFRG